MDTEPPATSTEVPKKPSHTERLGRRITNCLGILSFLDLILAPGVHYFVSPYIEPQKARIFTYIALQLLLVWMITVQLVLHWLYAFICARTPSDPPKKT